MYCVINITQNTYNQLWQNSVFECVQQTTLKILNLEHCAHCTFIVIRPRTVLRKLSWRCPFVVHSEAGAHTPSRHYAIGNVPWISPIKPITLLWPSAGAVIWRRYREIRSVLPFVTVILILQVLRADSHQSLFQCCLCKRTGVSTRVATIAHTKWKCHLLHIVVIYITCGLLFIDGRIVRRKTWIVTISSVSFFKLWFLQHASTGLGCTKPVLQKLFFIFRPFPPRPVVPY
jgi:hypothetical protein